MYQMNENDELTGEKLAEFIEQHEMDKLRWIELENQYKSNPPILHQDDKEKGKPDNRIVANFGRYLVVNFNGYFIGKPVEVEHENETVKEAIDDFWNQNNMDDVLDELGKLTSIYGKAYLFMYQDEDTKTRVAYVEPFELFNIYSNHLKPTTLYTVKPELQDDGTYEGQIYDSETWVDFLLDGTELVTVDPEEGGQLFYGRPPAIEWVENEERQSLIEPVETMIDAYNKVLSEKNNDIDYFADAYLAIIGALMDKDTAEKMRDNRLINLEVDDAKKVVIEFLEKPNADESQENQLDRLERLIYTLSMVTNTSENQAGMGAGGVASGEALKVKQQSMANMAKSKERKFQASLQTMFRMLFQIPTNVTKTLADEYLNIEYNWSRNVINNVTEEVDNATKLDGVISQKRQLQMLSFIKSVEDELKQIEKENEEPPMYDKDFGKGNDLDE